MKPPDVVLDVAMAPAATLARVAGAINRRERRMFGILKTKNEYVGLTSADGFEIWERQRRTVHAVAHVRPHGGGSRIELRFVFPPARWALTVLFFALYGLVAVALALLPPETEVSGLELAAIVAGAAVLAAGFAYAAARQRADLAAFVARLFADRLG